MSYSPAGQVTQRTINNSAYAYSTPSLTQSYSPNGLNQYGAVGGTNYTYDSRGNLTCVSTGANCTGTVSRNYSYDLENHLTAESSSSTTIGYDPLDRLHQTTASSTTEQYLCDGNNLVVEYDGSGNILRRYVPGPGDDQPLVWYEGSGLSTPNWLHTDQQGSIVATSNSAGTAGSTYSYDPNGVPSGGWGSSPATPIFRYTGQAALASAKLYYYKARMYDPALGRFLQTDPVAYSAGLNLYAYVNNDPVNYDDPNGMDAVASADNCQPVGDDDKNMWVCPHDSVTVSATRIAVNGGPSSASRGRGSPDLNDPGSQGGTNNYPPGAACHRTSNGQGLNTSSISLTLGGGWLNVSGQATGGLAIDGQGHVAFIWSTGGSAGTSVSTGLSGIFGVNVSSSNARSVDALGGWFAEQNVGVGEGLAAAGTAFEGRDLSGNSVGGGGVTLGVGIGARFSTGASYTHVIKLPGYGGC